MSQAAQPVARERRKITQNAPIVDKRETSEAGSSRASKFLKRKPDPSKPFARTSSRRKVDSSSEATRLQQIHSQKFLDSLGLSSKLEASDQSVTVNPQPVEVRRQKDTKRPLLVAVSSDNSLLRNSRAGSQTSRQERNGYNRDAGDKKFTRNQQQTFNPDYGFSSTELNAESLPKATTKKSKTEFFSCPFDESVIQSELTSHDMSRITTIEENWEAKNKLLEREIELCMERQYLLKMEKTHLEGLLGEKEKVIGRLQRQKSFLLLKAQKELEDMKGTLQEEVESLSRALSQEEQRNKSIKQENEFLQQQLLQRSQQLMQIKNKHLAVEKHQRGSKIDKKTPEDTSSSSKEGEFDAITELDKARGINLKQQEEIRYLRVQNQCLRMSREQVKRLQKETGRLKDERDYFKRKVLEHIKKHNKVSFSEEGSSLFELSEISLDM